MANPYRNTGKAGSPAHFIGPIGRGVMKVAKAFGNTAKQYYKKFTRPNPANQQTTREIRPLITGNKVYGRKEIEQAFKQRFGQQATRTPKAPEIKTVTKKKGMFGGTSYGTDVTNFGRPDAVVKMREVMKKSGQYPKTGGR